MNQSTSRREFLATSALIAAGLALGPSHASSNPPTTTKEPARERNNMNTRKLGELAVSEIGAGCMSISANYGPPADKDQGIEVIRAAHEKGVTFFDTAEVYGPYTNEELVGEALAPDPRQGGHRHQVRLRHRQRPVGSIAGRSTSRRWSRSRSSACGPTASTSLPASRRPERAHRRRRRCGQGTHSAGKVLHFGLSEAGAKTIRRAHAVQPVAAIQSEYSLWSGAPNRTACSTTCEELGIGFVPWGPVGMGYLTGKIDARTKLDPEKDFRHGFDRFTPENIEANWPFVELLKRVAAREERDPGSNRSRLAPGSEAVDRPHPWDTQHRAPEREPRGDSSRSDACRPS